MDELNLEPGFALSDVVHKDRDLYLEVCQSYFELYGVAIKVFDEKGTILFDVPGPTTLCQYVFKIPPCRQACINLVNSIRRDLPAFRTIEKKLCFTGAQYRIHPIHYGSDVVGKVLFGPFLPADLREFPAEFLAMDRGIDSWMAWEAAQRFRRIHSRLADMIARNLATVFEVMAFVGFKGLMTTTMHVQSLSEAFNEISEKNKQLEEHLQQLNNLNHQRAHFLSTLSQELKAPLTNLIGYAEMLQEGVGGRVTEDQREFLRTIIDQGELMFSLTQTMEELSLIERGRVEISPELFEVSALLPQIVRHGNRLGESRDILVQLVSPMDQLAEVSADPEKALSILTRIMDNAIKFSPAGGRIEVSAKEEYLPGESDDFIDGFLAITIADRGIGIPKEKIEHIFEPFYTVEQGPDRTYSGSGVGLTIAKAYVDAHAGQIKVKSVLGQGTEVTVYLPLRRSAGQNP